MEAVDVGVVLREARMVSSVFRQRGGKRQTMGTQASSQTQFPARTESELRAAIGAIVATSSPLGDGGYGKSIEVQGEIGPTRSSLIFPFQCGGLTLKGSGLIIIGDGVALGIHLRTPQDFTVDGISIRAEPGSSPHILFKSDGTRTVVRGVRVLFDATATGAFTQFHFTRQASISGSTLTANTGGVGILVSGVTSGAAIIGNDLAFTDVNTSAGTASTIIGNRNIGAASSFDATDIFEAGGDPLNT